MLYSINQVEQKACVEVENIYFSENVQRKLNINFEIIIDSFKDNNLIIKELINKIGYENNVFK